MSSHEQSPQSEEPEGRKELSHIPSWVMVGFALGAVTVLTWDMRPRSDEHADAMPANESRGATVAATTQHQPAPGPEKAAPAPETAGQRIQTIDNVFAVWGQYALWQDDLTQVALWNSDKGDFTDCYEVMRFGGRFFYRPMTELTWPLVGRDVSKDAPLRFTEPPTEHDERLAQGLPFPELWIRLGRPDFNIDIPHSQPAVDNPPPPAPPAAP